MRHAPGSEGWDLINARKMAVTLKPGTAIFHNADRFAMVRSRHLDMAIRGACLVAQNGDLVNWSTGAKGARRQRDGSRCHHQSHHPRRQAETAGTCTLPLTSAGCVTRFYTSLAEVDCADGRFALRDKLPGVSLDD